MSPELRHRWKLAAFKIGCVLVIAFLGLLTLEGAARYLGLGDPVLYYNDAWGGMRPLPNQKHSRLGGAIVTVDSNGYRTPVPDAPGAMRILYLGDSLTWGGSSIDDSAIFSEVAADVLREKNRPVYAMNSGVNATALVNHAEIFQHYVDQNGRLDAVVWLFPWGDVQRTFASGGPMFPARYKPKFALVEVIDYLITKFWANFLRDVPPTKDDFLTPNRPAGQDLSFEDKCEQERKARNLDAVRGVVAEARRRGVPIVMGVSPYRNGDDLEPIPDEAKSFLDEMAGDGAIIVDASAALTDESGSAKGVYLDNVHLSQEGHRRVGRALGAAINEALSTKGS